MLRCVSVRRNHWRTKAATAAALRLRTSPAASLEGPAEDARAAVAVLAADLREAGEAAIAVVGLAEAAPARGELPVR